MNAGNDWPSSRALLTLKPWRRRRILKSIWTIQQTARNCAGQFSIWSPGEKRQTGGANPRYDERKGNRINAPAVHYNGDPISPAESLAVRRYPQPGQGSAFGITR